ncbi:uncharacterized protein RSE6_02395 [Rhynchosporium secalis]|uniref:Uncharacterized protein n=1 Tax=Rhynchosporium secalis TaxID=38038 RepID=A0A1E1M034_RHYSE|nr:uncharacterized protein RSE6_02395 [Rhynchosporium secalis]
MIPTYQIFVCLSRMDTGGSYLGSHHDLHAGAGEYFVDGVVDARLGVPCLAFIARPFVEIDFWICLRWKEHDTWMTSCMDWFETIYLAYLLGYSLAYVLAAYLAVAS